MIMADIFSLDNTLNLILDENISDLNTKGEKGAECV